MQSQDLHDHLNSQRHIGTWCFGASVGVERYPDNFKPPREVTKYDGSDNPSLWLEEYETTMMIKNVSEMIVTRYLPMMMKGAASYWIQGLPTNSIHSWNDMRRVFIRNFEGNLQEASHGQGHRRLRAAEEQKYSQVSGSLGKASQLSSRSQQGICL
jgi:hypothetical protein